ncbi:hypothetical protein [Ktedonospora formicarum]|uniref:Uncharacterized protein n=1 Tax=Ktedonospora formicarum TaxID=2778364 RepID=A0A8J3MTY0_9CHLR|nr:hypothetical protein [Ktedonospora formicarum]GHO48672.1 hypothetical protein KSX_68350 [Ktedonospora formicarum]
MLVYIVSGSLFVGSFQTRKHVSEGLEHDKQSVQHARQDLEAEVQ